MNEERIEEEAEKARAFVQKSDAYNPDHASIEQSREYLRTLIALLNEDLSTL